MTTGRLFLAMTLVLGVGGGAFAIDSCPAAPDPFVTRTELGGTAPEGASSMLRFAQISDVHILDDDGQLLLGLSPIDGTISRVSTAQRMQDEYTDEVLNSIVGAIDACTSASRPIEFMISTGDNVDLGLVNEVRRFIDNIDGTFDAPTAYEEKCRVALGPAAALVGDTACKRPTGNGVADTQTVDPDPADPTYQSTQTRPVRQAVDTLSAVLTGRAADGGTDPSRQTFTQAPGLPQALRCNAGATGCAHRGLDDDIPWYVAFGNHDGTARGTVPYQPGFQEAATALGRHYMQLQHEFIDEFSKTTALPGPIGHGFAEADAARRNDGDERNDGYYAFDWPKNGPARFRMIVLNTLIDGVEGGVDLGASLPVVGPVQVRNPFALDSGAIDTDQFDWLKSELAALDGTKKLALVFSHHPDLSFADRGDFGFAVPGYVTAAALDAELASHPNLIAWVAGHTHRNRIRAFQVTNGVGSNGDITAPVACKAATCSGFWEIETSSLIDSPQEARIVEISTNPGQGTGAIRATLIEHDVTKSRTLAEADDRCQFYLDDPAAAQRLITEADISAFCTQGGTRSGEAGDRNVELVFQLP